MCSTPVFLNAKHAAEMVAPVVTTSSISKILLLLPPSDDLKSDFRRESRFWWGRVECGALLKLLLSSSMTGILVPSCFSIVEEIVCAISSH